MTIPGEKSLRHRLFYGLVEVEVEGLVTLGKGCPWTISPAGLGEHSIVYSAGVGGDVSFERQLVDQFGCDVWLLDPSRVGIETMKQEQNHHPKMRFKAAALVGGREGFEGSAQVAADGYLTKGDADGKSEPMASTTLGELMRENGHAKIDLLKMDIEGFEYGVLDEILRDRLPVSQICVELHQQPHFEIPKRKKIEAILNLRLHGFELVHQVGYDHTFLKR